MASKNRSLHERVRRARLKGKFKNWTNNPKGGKQAALKKYSFKTWTSPAKDVVDPNWPTKKVSDPGALTLRGRNRLSNAGRFKPERDRFGEVIGKLPVDSAGNYRGLVTAGLHADINPAAPPPAPTEIMMARAHGVNRFPRAVVLDQLQQVRDGRLQWHRRFNCVVLREEPTFKLTMYFEGTTFFLVEEDLRKNVARRSSPRNSKEKLLFHYKREWLSWIEEMPLLVDSE